MKNINVPIEHDCRLRFDRLSKTYTLCIPVTKEVEKVKKKAEEIIALDAGEKVFMSFYSLDKFGQIGINMRKKILKIQEKIKKYQRILSKGENRKGDKLKNKGAIRKRIMNKYKKINNIVKELHNQTANYLCNNYKRILLPKFETQNMVMNEETRKKRIKENVKKIFEINGEGSEGGRKKLRKYEKKRRMNGKYKFVLNMLSHYKFKQHLLNKSKEKGCQVEIVTEEYTSTTCTKCEKEAQSTTKKK